MATSRKYRVYHPTDVLRKAVATQRKANGVNTAEFITAALTDSLPHIVQGIQALLGSPSRSKRRPARWPVGTDNIEVLRVASHATGLPQERLLLSSLALFCQKGGK